MNCINYESGLLIKESIAWDVLLNLEWFKNSFYNGYSLYQIILNKLHDLIKWKWKIVRWV